MIRLRGLLCHLAGGDARDEERCCSQTELPMKFCVPVRRLPATAVAGSQQMFNNGVEATYSFEDRSRDHAQP